MIQDLIESCLDLKNNYSKNSAIQNTEFPGKNTKLTHAQIFHSIQT